MHVGIFPVMAGRQAGGPETYERCLVEHIASQDHDNQYDVFCLSNEAAQSFNIKQDNFTMHVLRPRSRWISIPASLPLAVIKSGAGIMHATFTPPPFSPVDYIFTHHCFSTFVHPEFYDTRTLLRLNKLIIHGLKKAKHIICVSENVRDLSAEKFGIPIDKMSVVYNGVSKDFTSIPQDQAKSTITERYGINSPYLLFVGTLQARKNIIRTIEAFASFKNSTQDDIKLVLAGRRTFRSDGIDEAIRKYDMSDHVIEIGHVAHEDLPSLYNAAEMLVFASLWEGFGIPVAEAMACGTPVVTSNLASLPEVSAGAAVLVDPYSVDDIARGIHDVYTDTALRKSLVDKGLERAEIYTWERAAQQTLDIYRNYIAA